MARKYLGFNDYGHRPYIDSTTGELMVYDSATGMYKSSSSGDISSGPIEEVLAHSACTLSERVEQLEKTLIDVLTGKVYIPELLVKNLRCYGENNLFVVGTTAPTLPPDRAGQFYIDTVSGAVYKSTGNARVADWKNL